MAHVRPGDCFDDLTAAVTEIGINNLTAEDTLDTSVAKDCTSTVVACPMDTIWPLKCHTALTNLAEAIEKNRGLDNIGTVHLHPFWKSLRAYKLVSMFLYHHSENPVIKSQDQTPHQT